MVGHVRHLTLLEWDPPFGVLREVYWYHLDNTRTTCSADLFYVSEDDGGLLIPCYD
jgi:hypothetical protein